jgi:ABC-type transporter Mla MlaB component
VRTPASAGGPAALVVALDSSLTVAGLRPLCDRVRTGLELSGARLVICDVAETAAVDVVTIDALARVQLTAKRCGARMRLRHAPEELRRLLVLVGLDRVIGTAPCSERRAETEEREQRLGVEERVHRRDPPV